jgi:hypothetical protein
MNAEAVRKPEARRVSPDILGTVPRDVRLTSSGMAVVACAIALMIAAIAIPLSLSVLYVRSQGERELRAHNAVWTDAEVMEVDTKNGERPRRVVTYRYEAADRSYTGRATIRRNDSRGAARGSSIRVGYASSRPAMSWVPGYESSGMPLGAIPLTAAALLFAAAGCGWSVRRQWMLLSEGRGAEARITGHKKVHSDKHQVVRVSYEFQTISGSTQTAHYEMGKTPPPIGTTMPIVYHREKPSWNAPYPLKLVRPGHSD